jgi:hypothetical protein
MMNIQSNGPQGPRHETRGMVKILRLSRMAKLLRAIPELSIAAWTNRDTDHPTAR